MAELDGERMREVGRGIERMADRTDDLDVRRTIEKHQVALLILVLAAIGALEPVIKLAMEKLTAPIYGETSGLVKPADENVIGENNAEK